MGVNVYGFVEINTVKVSCISKWSKELEASLFLERDYDLFSHIFGVRNSS